MATLGNPLQTLKQHFNSFEPQFYWHWKMKAKDENELNMLAMLEKAKPASQRFERAFYQMTNVRHWTPLHVAAMEGYKAGIVFLRTQGVFLHPQDDYGHTPLDYCRLYHPELVPLLEPNTKFLQAFLEKWHVALSQKDTHYHAGTDDFGVEIQELLLSDSPLPSRSEEKCYKGDSFIKNLEQLSRKLGFVLKVDTVQYMVRDFRIRLPTGQFGLPACSENVTMAVTRAESLSLALQNKAEFLATHEYFDGCLGGVNKNFCEKRADFSSSLNDLLPLPFYLEGGNHYQVFLEGRKKVILGNDCLYMILNQFRLDKRFEDPRFSIDAKAKQIEETLTLEQIKQVLPEMYSQGLLKETKGCSKGLIQDITPIFSRVLPSHILQGKDIPPGAYLEEAKKQELFTPLNLSEQKIMGSRHIVARYLAQISRVKLCLAQTFGVSEEDLIFLPQADYHVDVFALPGPNGSFFLQNYRCTYELLQQIESNSAQLQLPPDDLVLLKRYKQTAQTLDRQLKHLLQAAQEKLEAAGFTVIPTPGIFYDATPMSINLLTPTAAVTNNINFINAITGYSPKTGRYYYIAGGAETGGREGAFKTGSRLGYVLMDAYHEFLKSYQKDIDFFPIGQNPDLPGDFLESRSYLNVIGKQAGIHCFSTELKTASHSTYSAELD